MESLYFLLDEHSHLIDGLLSFISLNYHFGCLEFNIVKDSYFVSKLWYIAEKDLCPSLQTTSNLTSWPSIEPTVLRELIFL